MGGSGKTTLARKLYNNKEIWERFASRAWVCISQEWSTPQLLGEICVQIGVQLQSGGETSFPFHKLHEFLMRRSCFIVLDDVWRVEALQELLPILLSTNSTSSSGRILITTRNRKVVNFPILGGLHIHETRCLTPNESWELFSNIICKNWQGFCIFEEASNFAQIGKKILQKCNGLPLAIVTLVGLLSTKNSVQDWESVNNDVMLRIIKHNNGSYDYEAMGEILELSYLDLPYYLKSCFLYSGIFQEGIHISVDQLTQLWIAEGFVKSNLCNESETLEDQARDFLDELIQRCMVQVDGIDYEGKTQTIQIHDLMRDFCVKKARDLSFDVSSSSISYSTSMMHMSHRAVIHKGKSFSTYNPNLRSFIFYEDRGGGITKLDFPYEKMKFLRVLHLVKVDLGDSIEGIGNLPLLRYLKIERCHGIKKLMQSTVTFKNLLSYAYTGTEGQSLPNNGVGSMEHLRHLSLLCDGASAGQTLGVDKSRNLQVLKALAGDWLAKELYFVTVGLQELHLTTIHSQEQLEAVSHFVRNPNSHLHTLRLSLREDSRLEFHLEKLKLECCQLLKRLVLWGKIRKQHLPLQLPPNLTSLELRATQIENEEDLKQAFARLDQLRHLILDSEAYNASRLTMIGLPQLQELTLSNMSQLREWRVDRGALPQLKMLLILNCCKLEGIPIGIRYMSNLQCLRAHFVSKSFCKRVRRPFRREDNGDDGDGGKDFHLIQHIPLVEVRNLINFPNNTTCSI